MRANTLRDNMKNKVFKYLGLIAFTLVLLSGCGGGGGSSGSTGPSATTYTISGTLTGLPTGAQVTLQNNGADPITLSANGVFTFSTPIANGGSYSVVVSNQPSGESCYITNGTNTGVVAGANVTTVSAVCQSFTLSLSNDLIPIGQSADLTWTATDVSACNASGSWNGSQATQGTVSLTGATAGYFTYTLTCQTASGSLTQSVVLTVYGDTPTNRVSPTSQPIWYQASLELPPPNQIISFQTTSVVPALPAAPANTSAYIGCWTGLEPLSNSINYSPINLGVLQPVIEDFQPFQAWDAVSIYDNNSGTLPPIVSGTQNSSYAQEIDGINNFNAYNQFYVNPGDVLTESVTLNESSGYWTVTLTDTTQNKSNTLIMNMQGQQQNYAVFALEVWYGMTMPYPVVFTNSTITFASPDTTGACSNTLGQENNYVMTPPTLDSTGTKCNISKVILNQN